MCSTAIYLVLGLALLLVVNLPTALAGFLVVAPMILATGRTVGVRRPRP